MSAQNQNGLRLEFQLWKIYRGQVKLSWSLWSQSCHLIHLRICCCSQPSQNPLCLYHFINGSVKWIKTLTFFMSHEILSGHLEKVSCSNDRRASKIWPACLLASYQPTCMLFNVCNMTEKENPIIRQRTNRYTFDHITKKSFLENPSRNLATRGSDIP